MRVASDAETRHRDAVAQSIAWARAAAAGGDYADALCWLQVVAAVGHILTGDEERDRQEWLLRVGDSGPARANGRTEAWR